MSKPVTALPRRRFLQASGSTMLAAAIGAPMILTSKTSRAAGRLVVVSWGGNYRVGVEEALAKPFAKEFGVEVILIDTPDLAKVKAQVMTKNVEWDVFDVVGPMGFTGSKNGYWEQLDPALFDSKDLIAPVTKDMVPFYGFTGGFCYDSKKHPEAPKTWADFWDVKKFPGRRALRNRASETLEVALLADGVPADKMYPLDIERAFKALDRLKPHVGKWVDQTPQTVSLVQTGEIDYSYTYTTRVKAAQEAGQTIDFAFDENLIGLEYLAVLKGAPNKTNAMKFLQFAMRPENQAALMNHLANTPASKKALEMVKPDVRKWMSNPGNPKHVVSNDMWWADHYDDVSRRFKEWALT
ncbi:ABC transporter substrate-binding protein [Pigmentiphaga aceris]|uniref:ABC transporter substrate-binding protein n=1 Tax=Pigmentiphaga aceris TaxID=1940612 RepID=A0A5C0ARI6_9BURK|nr:ABC transporter substrate-binding protein [Pigmentiphaga aceris]QEI04742.1 ABC transporter substrate-binding protein [Pigmentiphaga aceris]